jgi:2-dehydropantoate 2-reductase
MQNGIPEFAVAEVAGKERTVGCIVGWGATMLDVGELELTAEGEFILGNLFDIDDHSLLLISGILAAAFPARISRDMIGHRYAKLVINSCIAPLGAICGLSFGELLARKDIRNIMIAIVRECIAVADALSIKVEPVIGNIDYYKFLNGSTFIANFKRHLLLRIMGLRYKRARSSSLTSLMRGKPTEIDYLNGYVMRKGREHNIPTPVNDVIIEMVKEIEQGKRPISIENLRNPVFDQL